MKKLTIEEARKILFDVVKNNKTHKDYKRTVENKDLYYKLITGDGVNELIPHYKRRLNDEDFRMVKEITQAITPAVSSNVMDVFSKLFQVIPSVRIIDWDDDMDTEERIKVVEEVLSTFHSDQPVEHWLEDRFKALTFTDPNAFILVRFDEFDANVEKPKPYPVEIPCDEAIYFEFDNGRTVFVIQKETIAYLDAKGNERDGAKYTMYLRNEIITLVQVDKGQGASLSPSMELSLDGYFRPDKNRLFVYEEFSPMSIIVPAKRVGYIGDLMTEGRTFVNPFHCAIPYFMKSIKSVSEQDLNHTLHVFLQKIEHEQRCTINTATEVCMTSGEKISDCLQCNRTGLRSHTSAQDVLRLKLPEHPADMFPINNLIGYVTLPTEIVTIVDEYVEKITDKILKTVFNSQGFTRPTVTDTATQSLIDLSFIYDKLRPFGAQVSAMWMFITKVSAAYLDLGKKIKVTHRYPKDLKLQNRAILLAELKAANDSGANSYIKMEINNDLMSQVYADRPVELNEIRVREKFFPFPGKDELEILNIINGTNTPKRVKVLYENFDRIFNEIEFELITQPDPKYFYDLPYKEQKELIDLKVQGIMEEINAESPSAFDIRK